VPPWAPRGRTTRPAPQGTPRTWRGARRAAP
jgi:hypothetical protein